MADAAVQGEPDPPTLETLPTELVLDIFHSCLQHQTTAVNFLTAAAALVSTCKQLKEALFPAVHNVLSLKERLGNVALFSDGHWIHQHLPAAAGDVISWQRQLAAGNTHVTSCVNVIGREGFEPKTLLFWHCKNLQPSECRFAGSLLMSAPAFHCIHLSQNDGMGDEGLRFFLPALARQLTSNRNCGPRRVLLHWSTAEQARIGDRLSTLKIDSCGLGDDSACAIEQLLDSVTADGSRLTLTELSLASNRFGERGMAALEAIRVKWPRLAVTVERGWRPPMGDPYA